MSSAKDAANLRYALPEASLRGAAALVHAQDARGQLDVLVTNAGVLEQWKRIAESDPEEWWNTFEVNVRGTYLAARCVFLSQ